MATFDCVVDTTPMAESVDRVNAHVVTVGAAVTAMEAAVVATEHETSQNICNNLDKGFFLLMRSQISQKLAANYSIVNSKLMSMAQIGKSIDAMHRQMENDFQMIKRRYMKLFHSLDKELEVRIKELDKPAMDIASYRDSLIMNRVKNDSAAVLFYNYDTQTTAQKALTARLKVKAQKSIAAMTVNASNAQTYAKKITHMMAPVQEKENKPLYVPVLCTESSSMFAKGNQMSEVFIPEVMSQKAKAAVENTVTQGNAEINLKDLTAEEKQEIKNAFLKQISASGLNQRTTDMMMKLFDGGNV